MAPRSRCMSGNTCGCRMSWTYHWAVMVPWINTMVDLAPFRCSPVSSCPAPLQTETSMVGVKGSRRNGRRHPQCPSTRCLYIVREDTGNPSEGATCAWILADEAVGRTRAFFMMWHSFRQFFGGHPGPDFRINDISRIHWSQHLTAQSEWFN
ncbi:uncharacterized protein TNCV_136001 [Trichonephila clavipes]|nr:uncharacterized protein TNCV_136001 [Trichonephila clavipes]